MRTLYEWLSLLIQLLSVVIVVLVLYLTLSGSAKIVELETNNKNLAARIEGLEEEIHGFRHNEAYDARMAVNELSNFQLNQERFRNDMLRDVREYKDTVEVYKKLITEMQQKTGEKNEQVTK